MMSLQALRTQRGFTLIETVIVILLLGIASAAVISLNGGLYKNVQQTRNVQSDTQLLQACAEYVMVSRRLSGFNSAPNYDAACEGLPIVAPNSNKFAITTTLNYTGSSCPTGAVCQSVTISVNSTASTVGPVTLQLVKY